VGTRSEILKPMAPNNLSAIFLGSVIILAIRTTFAREGKHDGALAVCPATRPSDPAPVRNERLGAKICAIEIILPRIGNGTKPSA
jgi:hypothetical protein